LSGSVSLSPTLLPVLGLVIGVAGTWLAQGAIPLASRSRAWIRQQGEGDSAADEDAEPDPGRQSTVPDRLNVAGRTPASLAAAELGFWLPGFGAIFGAASLLLAIAVASGAISALGAAAMLLLGAFAFITLVHVLAALRDGQSVSVDSYWGGLGGSSGGWRVSSAAMLCVILLLLISALVAVAQMETFAKAPGKGISSADKLETQKSAQGRAH
jgi:hypothetical protein